MRQRGQGFRRRLALARALAASPLRYGRAMETSREPIHDVLSGKVRVVDTKRQQLQKLAGELPPKWDWEDEARVSERKLQMRKAFEEVYGAPFESANWIEVPTEHGPQMIRCCDVIALMPDVHFQTSYVPFRNGATGKIEVNAVDSSAQPRALTVLTMRTGHQFVVDVHPRIVADWIAPWWTRPGPDPVKGSHEPQKEDGPTRDEKP